MCYIFIFFILLGEGGNVMSQCNQINDFNDGWYSQGGNWNILGAGNIVHQTVNGADVYFLNGTPLINTSISGNIRTDDNDDDQMGFVFGLQGTLGVGNYHYYLFHWDEGGNGNGMYIKEIDQNGSTTIFSDPGNYWVRHFNHSFTIDYFSTGFSVTIDGVVVHTENTAMSPGEFGFYNRSQADVTYSNLVYTGIFDYSILKDSICEGEEVEVSLEPGVYDLSTIIWDMGDGTTYGGLENVSHVYSSYGNFSITCSGSDLNGCNGSVTKEVVVVPSPIASFNYQNSCEYIDVDFLNSSTVLSSDVIISYKWDIGTLSSREEDTIVNFNTHGSYNVTLEVETVFGCVDDTINEIFVYNTPVSLFSVDDACVNEVAIFDNNSSVVDDVIVDYMWAFGDVIPITQVQSTVYEPEYEYFQPGSFDVRLIVETENGCRDTSFQSTDRYAVPIINFYAPNKCKYDSVPFSNYSSINFPGVLSTISWDYGDGNSSSVFEESHKYNSSGLFLVSLLVESSNGCEAQMQREVEVYEVPVSIFQSTEVCDNGSPTQFQNMSTIPSGAIIISDWNFGDGASGSNVNPSHDYSLPGVYNVRLISMSDNGCFDTLVNPVLVKASPIASFYADKTSSCSPLCVGFEDQSEVNSSSLVSQEWFFNNERLFVGDSFDHCFINDSEDEDIKIDIKYIVTNDVGCEDTLTAEDYLVVYHNPNSLFDILPAITNMYEREVEMENKSTGSDDFLWFLTPVETSELFEPSFEYPDTGTYKVLLIAYTDNSCVDSSYQSLSIEPVENVYVPNAFTPNGDGANDVFLVSTFGVQEEGFYLRVFDKWGEIVFESQELHKGWDGMHKNDLCKSDVYVYSVDYLDVTGSLNSFRGTVSLIR